MTTTAIAKLIFQIINIKRANNTTQASAFLGIVDIHLRYTDHTLLLIFFSREDRTNTD